MPHLGFDLIKTLLPLRKTSNRRAVISIYMPCWLIATDTGWHLGGICLQLKIQRQSSQALLKRCVIGSLWLLAKPPDPISTSLEANDTKFFNALLVLGGGFLK